MLEELEPDPEVEGEELELVDEDLEVTEEPDKIGDVGGRCIGITS